MRNDNSGTQITTDADSRVTKIGQTLRKYRLDELPQLLDIISGNMSFVGTRPEVPEFVSQYTDEMKATLLLPAGVTSEASIQYKDEAELLKNVKDEDVHAFYVEKILPEKMKYNLQSIRNFSCWNDWKTMLKTVGIVAK
jgi:lipopolysaccharide/colanic/teichoic acid biosynthesis glycosyltransferase